MLTRRTLFSSAMTAMTRRFFAELRSEFSCGAQALKSPMSKSKGTAMVLRFAVCAACACVEGVGDGLGEGAQTRKHLARCGGVG